MLFLISCKSNKEEKTEKFQKHRDKIINAQDKIIDIKNNIIFGECWLNIIDDILIVNEYFPSGDKGIHLFNKNTFEYITSTAIIGKGPGEVARQGRMAVDSKNRILWLSDPGRKVMWKFPLDSVLNNERYKPTENLDLYDDLSVDRFGFLNDSIALGKAIRVLSNSSFEMAMAKLNLNTNITEMYGYEHPEAVGKLSNSFFKLSVENNLYVNCYAFCDLMTICDLDGKLKYNINGPGGLKNKGGKKSYFSNVDMFNNNIIASYNGGARLIYDEYKRLRGNYPTKFMIFELNGGYKETIETGHKFINFCVDEENKRVILCFESRENLLGYINLNID